MARPKKLRTLVDEYLGHLRDKGLMTSTRATYRSELRHFVQWAELEQRDTAKSLNADMADEYIRTTVLYQNVGEEASGNALADASIEKDSPDGWQGS